MSPEFRELVDKLKRAARDEDELAGIDAVAEMAGEALSDLRDIRKALVKLANG